MKYLLLYLPTIVTGFVIYCTLLGSLFNKDWISNKIDNIEKKSLKYRDINTIYPQKSHFAFYSVCLLSIILVFAWGIMRITGGKSFNEFSQISNSIYTFSIAIVTLSLALTNFDKDHFLVFTIIDVLKMYNIKGWIKMNLITSLLIFICQILVNQDKIEWLQIWTIVFFWTLVIYNILSVIFILAIVLNIELSDKKMDILSELYRVFWLYDINGRYVKAVEKWENKPVEINVRYLLNEYLYASEKIKGKIIYFQFVSTVGTEIYKFYKKYSRKYMKNILIISYLSSIIISARTKDVLSFFLNTASCLVMFILLYLINAKIKTFKQTLARLCIDEKGYSICIEKENNKNIERFIPEVGLRIRNNKYKRYINSLNSLLAFLYIEIEIGVNPNTLCNTMSIIVKEIEEYYEKNIVIALPIWIFGFQIYCKSIGRKEDEFEHILINIKELYKKYKAKDGEVDFPKMLNSQIYNMNRYQNNEKYNFIRLKEYLDFLDKI